MYNITPNVKHITPAQNINRTPHTLKLHHSTFPSDKTCGVKTQPETE